MATDETRSSNDMSPVSTQEDRNSFMRREAVSSTVTHEASAGTTREMTSARKEHAAVDETEAADTTNDIHQVRDLLFGNQNREYERRFRLLERQNELLSSTLHRLTERMERMDAENNELRERIRDQHVHIQSRLEEMQMALHNRLDEIHRAMLDRLRTQQHEFDTRLEELHTATMSMFDELDGSKLDQQQMSDMVMDLALRIKRNIQKPVTQTSQRLLEE